VPQVVLGFARSFIEMGNDNIIFKRFLLRDPYNMVSVFDLLRLSLWKLALFYLALLAVVCALARERAESWRMLALLALNGVPVVVFALLWQGTPLERYLPLYPAFFLATAYALRSHARPARWLRPVVLGFMAVMLVSNVYALSARRLNRVPEAATERTRELVPLLQPQSVVVEVNEELKDLQWAYPLHPLNRVLRVYSAVSLGAADTARWRENFARQTLLAWRDGGDVWLSQRLLEERPRADLSWVEGADARVRWADVCAFFKQLDAGKIVGGGGSSGGGDGFVLVARTPRNEQLLSALAGATESSEPYAPAQKSD
jgi:4-amino-4-deoxy-L-arabinose transferase-like glycosyltransferase